MVIVNDRILKFFEIIFRHEIGGIALFPFIILSSKVGKNPRIINHERIHLRQQLELLVIPFYIWYLIEFYTKGYYNVSFEREAYENDCNLDYLKSRKMFNFVKYLKNE